MRLGDRYVPVSFAKIFLEKPFYRTFINNCYWNGLGSPHTQEVN